jgi:hypothetical protein
MMSCGATTSRTDDVVRRDDQPGRAGLSALHSLLCVNAHICRHCEERSDEAIQDVVRGPGLLRFARNDGADDTNLT